MAEEKKNRSEELESLDKKINEIINGWNQNPEEIVEFLQFSSKFSYAYSPRNMMLKEELYSVNPLKPGKNLVTL